MSTQAWLLPALPFAAAIIGLLFGRRLPGGPGPLAVTATLLSTVLAVPLVVGAVRAPTRVTETTHQLLSAGGVTVTAGTRVDGLSATVALMVCIVALLVQFYSIGYMKGDPRYSSYAAIVSLFTAAMLLVVLAADLLMLLIGWEVMGICSYLLIGHYWEHEYARSAAVKAFLTTRTGDVGFLFGIFTLGIGAGSFRISDVLAADLAHGTVVVGTLLLLCGVVGKSAQFPLHTWLPDAMAGPTPISALIHAATMVAAGIYLVARLFPVFTQSVVTLDVLAVIAAITMLGAALAALAQDDIKRVLAYSTVSQLAYMAGGLSVGGYGPGIFHLLTHAGFKALLFLAAGAVIHTVGTNLMSEMGGLRRGLPITSVGSIVSEPIETHGLARGEAKRERVAELLRLVGLDPNYVKRYPHEFSGGQRQRIGVARALAVEPEFIVCDEPISALDVSIQAQVLNLLTDLRSRLGLTYLFVAHDLSVVKHISDRVAVMYLGKVVEIGPPDQLYGAPGHPYTRALLSAVPVPDPVSERKRKRVILKGDVPSPVNPPPGCRFHTRCWLYERLGKPENCRTIDPPLEVLEGRHQAACHYAAEALKTDVGIAHLEQTRVRRGTPDSALALLKAGKAEAVTEAAIAAAAPAADTGAAI